MRLNNGEMPTSNVAVHCLDGSINIHAVVVSEEDIYEISAGAKNTNRTLIALNWNINLSIIAQRDICDMFNIYLVEKRRQYHSLFLTNYRENGRKRISFDLVYRLFNIVIQRYCATNHLSIEKIC